MVRQAHQPCFDKLTNHASTSSPTMLQQTHQPSKKQGKPFDLPKESFNFMPST